MHGVFWGVIMSMLQSNPCSILVHLGFQKALAAGFGFVALRQNLEC